MERQPQKSPLPCFGLEHDKFDPKCQTCPHYDDCRLYMGNRLDKVPLNRIKFDLMPETPEHSKFNFKKDAFEMDDPELPYLQRLYTDCFYSVFSRNALDNASQYKDLIARNARKASCSVRMFMLANMVAHQVHEQAVITNTEKGRATTFRVKLLTGDLSIKRAKAYQEMCHDRFGTFSLTSLSVLTDADTSELEATMLRSEITAAQWLVRYKIFNGGHGETALYESVELQLAPEWLAIEDTYFDLILKPYIERKLSSTERVERHRFSVFQVHGHYKRHITAQRHAFISRQRIMPEAVRSIVASVGRHPDDFLYPREAIKHPMAFWQTLALTLRHYHCWLYLNGEPSFFTPRRNETLVWRS